MASDSQSEFSPSDPIIERNIPDATNHPGNIFLDDEEVIISIPDTPNTSFQSWNATDDQGNIINSGSLETDGNKTIALGQPGIGWYRIQFFNEQNETQWWTTAAVLKRLEASIPQDSPICLDGAHSWFAKDNPSRQEQLSVIAALSGVNWIRDRLRWRDIQPEKDQFAQNTTYDQSAEIQTQKGLKVLQVFHDTPTWAAQNDSERGRFPNDLRHIYEFCKSMGQRFQNRVHAWEPWNEANSNHFGGHTVDEMCSFQKAAYLGFKAADPEIIVGWNAYAGVPTPLHTRGVLRNQAWLYFDTYNIHTYDWPHSYFDLWQPAREAASGRPLWITESDRGVQYQEDDPMFDLSPENEILKAKFMAQSYTTSLYAGSEKHFHFILGHYTESPNQVQFGLLRKDLTPRPAYVALAAIGRLMAGATSLGRHQIPEDPNIHIYGFTAQPDGNPQTVLVAWAEEQVDWEDRGKYTASWSLPSDLEIVEIYDYLGRMLGNQIPELLTSSPIFIVLPQDAAQQFSFHQPEPVPYREGTPSSVVMQVSLPRDSTVPVGGTPWAIEHEHQIEAGKETPIPLSVYNFSDTTLSGQVTVKHAPEDWVLSKTEWDIQFDPMQRKELSLTITIPEKEYSETTDTWLILEGNFDQDEPATLAFRLITTPGEGYKK